MALTNDVILDKALDKACRRIFADFIQNPLLLLREINLQARLQSIIQEELHVVGYPTTVPAKITKVKPNTEKGWNSPRYIPLQSTQLEIKISGCEINSENKAIKAIKGRKGRTDAVIFKNEKKVGLTREGNGALDIISCINLEHIAAAIEIKAAPSHFGSIPEGLREDVRKLLKLKKCSEEQKQTLQAHFLYFDKSLSIAEYESPVKPKAWHKETKKPEKPEKPKFTIKRKKPTEPFVHIWDIFDNEVRLRYAVEKHLGTVLFPFGR